MKILRALLFAAAALLPASALGFDPRLIRVGDRLKVTLFDTMDLPEIPGAAQGGDVAKMRMFYQRLDLSGEFTVDGSGAVSIPILGSISAAGKSSDQLRESVSAAMEKVAGRASNVSVGIVQRQPVFVTGEVRSPGAYAYSPGMIAIQAVALAGGVKTGGFDVSTLLSFADRKNQADVTATRLRRALAREAVLAAARDGVTNIAPPPRLLKLVTPNAANALIDSEKNALQAHVQEKQKVLEQKKAAVTAVQIEMVVIQAHLSDLDEEIKAKSEQLTKMEGLLANKVVVDERVAVVRRDFLDLQGRRSESNILLAQAKGRLSQAQADVQQTALAQQDDVNSEISQLDAQIVDADQSLHAGEALLNDLESRVPDASSKASVQIVRVDGSEAHLLAATDTTELAPGDVLKVGDDPLAPGARANVENSNPSEAHTEAVSR